MADLKSSDATNSSPPKFIIDIQKGKQYLDALEMQMPAHGWEKDGLCAQTDPEVFFPGKGGSIRSARMVCANCPVTSDCLANAILTDERHGVLGGKSSKERYRMIQQARERLAEQSELSGEDCA